MRTNRRTFALPSFQRSWGFWLLGAATVFSGLAYSPKSLADVEVLTMIRRYDDSETQVTTPVIEASGTFNKDQMKVNAGFVQDFLTSASADVITYSSRGRIDDHRVEYSFSFETLIPDGTMSVGYVQSDEDDYHSRIISAAGTREFFSKNTVLSFSFSNGNDNIRSVSDPTIDESMKNHVYSVSMTQVLSKVSLVQFIYDFRIESGFLASPYRRAKILDPLTNTATAEREIHPRTRNRNAWAVKYNHYLESLGLSTATTYRLYQDSWGVLSHTLEERITREFSRKLAMSFLVRYYTQGSAKFYEDYYTDSTVPFRTGNTTLSTFDSYLLGIRPTYLITDKIQAFAKVEYLMQNFKNLTEAGPSVTSLSDDKRAELQAVVVGAGLSVRF